MMRKCRFSRILPAGVAVTTAFSLLAAAPLLAASPIATKTSEEVRAEYGSLPLQFEANAGQTDQRVRFLSRGSGYTLYLTADEVVYTLEKRIYREGEEALPAALRVDGDRKAVREGQMPEYRRSVLRMRLDGADAAAKISAVEPLPAPVHYIRGGAAGPTNVTAHTFGGVRYQGVYDGINVLYHGKQSEVEYDFVVNPGADPSLIGMRFDGANAVERTASGDLALRIGGSVLYHQRPYAYQMVDGEQVEIAADFHVAPDGVVGFDLGSYDRNRELVIDPVLLVSTYVGGNTEDRINDIYVDATGNIYIVGQSNSTDYPVAGTPFGPIIRGGTDAVVTKINPSLTGFIQSTYVGGSLEEMAFGVAADASGVIYVTGNTTSTDFPVVLPEQSTLAGESDMFFFCLAADGASLINSTYFGGGEYETGYDIELFGSTIYIAGDTNSTDMPTTNPIQGSLAGPFDLFLATYTVSPTATSLTFASYIGGTGDERALGMDVDSAGRAYIVGEMATAGITPVRAIDSTFAGGASDGVIYGITPFGMPEINLTSYIGGAGTDILRDIEVFSDGSAVIVGGSEFTSSTDKFPIVNADHLQPLHGGGQDAVIMHLTGVSGSSASAAPVIDFSTFWGGSATDFAVEVSATTDSSAPFYVVGSTNSANFPVRAAIQSSLGGAFDAFFLQGTLAPRPFISISSYAGGANSDFGRGVGYDSSGNFYPAGFTSAFDFPTLNALPPDFNVHQGSEDGWLQKVQPCTFGLTPPVQTLFDGGPNTSAATVASSDSSCAWDISGTDISANQALPGLGSGSASFNIAANTGPPRTLTVNIAEHSFSITQKKTPTTFSDVALTDFFFDGANLLKIMGISNGCSATEFCPGQNITRGQMAVFVVRSIYGGDSFDFSTSPVFGDVPETHLFFKWIQKLSELGITNGCGPSSFCPDDLITREQAAVFLIRLRFGAAYAFSPAAGPIFTDVPGSNFFFAWIQELSEQGGTGGCSAGFYCPGLPITRGELAVILVRAGFNMLLIPGTPHIASADITSTEQGEVEVVTLTGVDTSFDGTTTVAVGQPGITTSSVTVISPTSLMVTLTVSGSADVRRYSIIATTGDEEAVLPLGFEVTAAPI